MHRVIDLYDGFYKPFGNYSFFYHLAHDTQEPESFFGDLFENCNIYPEYLDQYYFNFHSGEKLLNSSIERLIKYQYKFDLNEKRSYVEYKPATDTNTFLYPEMWQYVGNMFVTMYLNKYKRMLDIFLAEYNPIENYDRYEDLSKEYSYEGTSTEDGSNSDTGTVTTIDQIEGFNSNSFSDSDKSTRTDSLSHTSDIDRAEGHEGSETNINHIHGNIGVTTSDQMLTGYKEFWEKFNIQEMLCTDLDNILTTNTY